MGIWISLELGLRLVVSRGRRVVGWRVSDRLELPIVHIGKWDFGQLDEVGM